MRIKNMDLSTLMQAIRRNRQQLDDSKLRVERLIDKTGDSFYMAHCGDLWTLSLASVHAGKFNNWRRCRSNLRGTIPKKLLRIGAAIYTWPGKHRKLTQRRDELLGRLRPAVMEELRLCGYVTPDRPGPSKHSTIILTIDGSHGAYVRLVYNESLQYFCIADWSSNGMVVLCV